MRARLGFDPRGFHYGAATDGVRQILLDWEEIDWFALPRASEATARQLFVEHLALCRRHGPSLFANPIDISTRRGGLAEFQALCVQVRQPSTWDWKFAGLKRLLRLQRDATGWTLRKQALECGSAPAGQQPRPGDLFVVLGDQAYWCLYPLVPLEEALAPDQREGPAWYASYAVGDFIEALEWQFSTSSGDVSGNPFVPLLLCYAAGYYPFFVSRSEVSLFAFEPRR